jgi:hypothetical protein
VYFVQFWVFNTSDKRKLSVIFVRFRAPLQPEVMFAMVRLVL